MITSLDMERIKAFSLNLDGDMMIKIFGETLGKHLSEKFFENFNRDFLMFYCYLDVKTGQN